MDKKNEELIKQTEKAEFVFVKAITTKYNTAYKDVKAEVRRFIDAYGVDNALTNKALQYNRFDTLIDRIYANVAKIDITDPVQVNAFLKGQYINNYQGKAYIIETNWQKKLGIREVSRSRIDPLSGLGKASLKKNKAILKIDLDRAIQQSIAQGDTYGATNKRIKGVLEKSMDSAANVVTQESLQASAQGKWDALEKASKVLNIKKQWVATLDDRTRNSHRHLDGEVRDLDRSFSNGLSYPRDPSGPIEETANCRCEMIEIVEGYSNSADFRRARGLDGKNEVIPYQNYREWEKNRL